MLKKFSRSLERKRDGKTGLKYRFDVDVRSVTGAFGGNAVVRVLWTRGSRVQMTEPVQVNSGEAKFYQSLSQVATLYKDIQNHFDAKEYEFKLQSMGAENGGKKLTVGKGTIDLARLVAMGGCHDHPVSVMLTSTSPQLGKDLVLHLKVTSLQLKGTVFDDGFSTVSGLSNAPSSTSKSPSADQDLSGFDREMFRVHSGTIGALTISASTELSHSSDKSTDSAVDPLNSVAEAVVSNLQSRVDMLEAELKKKGMEKEELQKQLESNRRQAESETAFLKRELESERAQKLELETQLVQEVDDETCGHLDLEEALKAAIAPYEMRYEKLADDYQDYVQSCNAEIEALHEELLAAKDRNAKLENRLEMSERARESLNVEKRALEMSLIGTCSEQVDMDKERKELRQELTHVDEVMQDLIQTKVSFAELSERYTITKRDMCKLKERNLQLASKITKMETYLYHKQSGRSSRS